MLFLPTSLGCCERYIRKPISPLVTLLNSITATTTTIMLLLLLLLLLLLFVSYMESPPLSTVEFVPTFSQP